MSKRGATQGAEPKSVPRRASAARGGRPASQRQLRVAEEIRHILAGIFTKSEFRDPDLSGVAITITEVRISPDLRHATAFVTRLGRSDIGEKLPALARAAPYLRSQLAHELRLRVAPDLTFEADTALEYAMHINRLLHDPSVRQDLEEPNAP